MKNPYTIDRLLQKADFLGMYTIRSEQKQIASEKRIHEGEVVDYFKVSCCRKRGR